MERVTETEFEELDSLGIELTEISMTRLKETFRKSIETKDEDVDEMFECLKIIIEDGVYYVRYECPWVPPRRDPMYMYSTRFFEYKFEEFTELIQYLKIIYCIDFYHGDLSQEICDTINSGTLNFREINDDLIVVWATQNFHNNVLECLKKYPIFVS